MFYFHLDSTAQYIKGLSDVEADGGVYTRGLQCVTVLIGAYRVSSGLPVIGIVNQPFHSLDSAQKRYLMNMNIV